MTYGYYFSTKLGGNNLDSLVERTSNATPMSWVEVPPHATSKFFYKAEVK
jgi:hypothetical protein